MQQAYARALLRCFTRSLFLVQVVSDALVIGPTGFTALILLVVGAMLAVLCTCLALAIKFAPVSLNPLDPVRLLTGPLAFNL